MNPFSYIQRDNFFQPIGVFTSLGVANSRVTLRDRVQIFLKKAAIYENDMTLFFSFSLHRSNVNCENVNENLSLFCVMFVTVQVK